VIESRCCALILCSQYILKNGERIDRRGRGPGIQFGGAGVNGKEGDFRLVRLSQFTILIVMCE
jgi:hypothetical protein